MELAYAREAGRKLIGRAEKGTTNRSIGTAPPRIDITQRGRSVRPLRGIADQGRPADQVAARGDEVRNLKPWLSLPADQSARRTYGPRVIQRDVEAMKEDAMETEPSEMERDRIAVRFGLKRSRSSLRRTA